MAFPVPDHLPRRPKPLDVSSQILSKIDEATTKTLNTTLTSQWLKELDATILATKKAIHERILKDLPAFEQQFDSAKSVQTRLAALGSGVENIGKELTGEEGLIPQLSERLGTHSQLAQETQDAVVVSDVLSYLQKCKSAYNEITSLVTKGQLPAAMTACCQFESMLQGAFPVLHSSRVYSDIRAKFRITRDRAEEQLNDAYSRAIVVTASEITITTSVQVQSTDVMLTLDSILQSIPSASRTAHLTTLRKNIISHYVESLLTQPMSVTITSLPDGSHRLSKFPNPLENDHPKTRLETLTQALAFLASHIFPHFPELRQLLCKPVSDGVLKDVLVASIPATFNSLPPFLELVQFAVSFEEEHIQGILSNDPRDCPIKSWAENVSGHYERNRRRLILAKAREVICRPEDVKDTITVEVIEIVPVQVSEPTPEPVDDAWGFDGSEEKTKKGAVDEDAWGFGEEDKKDVADDDAWGFGEEEKKPSADDFGGDDNWGFDDDLPPAKTTQPIIKEPAPAPEPDPADAWGWNEDPTTNTDDPWDDPWNDPPAEPEPARAPSPPPPPLPVSPPIVSPRPAAGLAKFAAKGKKTHLNGNGNGHPPSAPPTPPPPVSASPKPALGLGKYAAKNKSVNSLALSSSAGSRPSTPYYSPALSSRDFAPSHTPPPPAPAPVAEPPKRPPKLVPPEPIRENYIVSGRARDILLLIKDTIRESEQFASSGLILKSDGQPGALLRHSAAYILDLHKAVYPVKFSSVLTSSLDHPMRFSNDCLYLAQEFESDLEQGEECKRRMKLLGECWFDDTLHKHKKVLNELLSGAQGFALLGEQDQFDDAENAVNQSLQTIRKVAGSWKPILTRSKYYTAIGSLVDTALSRVLDDVLALPDIPEVESHRISELCRIFNALEALFVEDPDKPSVVVAWVPSWLKFSYLSELLEASMADITYLFEEGALVDFELDELTKLVKALFADTPLRANTVNKIMGGHPISH